MIERCYRICGKKSGECSIDNKRQVMCFSDIVLNKASGIKTVIEAAAKSDREEELSARVKTALKDLEGLIDWVTFLPLAHDLRALINALHTEADGGSERRSKERYLLPRTSRGYIRMEIKTDAGATEASLVDFSKYGLKFRSPVPFEIGSVRECRLSAPHLPANTVSFMMNIKHCAEKEDGFHAGAQIEEIGSMPTMGTTRTISDFIQRTLMEEALTQSELHCRTLLDAVDDPLHIIDSDMRLVLTNTTFRKWNEDLGMGTDIIGKPLFEVYPFLSAKVRGEYEHVLKTGDRLMTEDETVINGRVFITETRKIPILVGERVTNIITVAKDVTERKKHELRLRESEEKYRSLVESTDDSIYVVDKECRYLFINSKHMGRMGLSSDHYLGKAYSDFHSPDETARFTERIEKVFRTGQPFQFEYLSSRDGKYFLQTLSPVKGQDGKPGAVSVISKNIDDRKQIEKERERLIQELQEALAQVKTLSGFLPICSYCKKVRDDKGYWSQIEQYIKEHSEAEFSHSICPECLKNHFPNYPKKK